MGSECHSGWTIEGHHIKPLARGGADEYKNIIALCFDCHRRTKLHGRWKLRQIDLFTAKFYLESKKLGFTSDCSDEEFLNQLKSTKCKTCKHGSEERGLKEPFNKLFCFCPIAEGETLPTSDPYLTGYVKPDDRCSRWQPKEEPKLKKQPKKRFGIF